MSAIKLTATLHIPKGKRITRSQLNELALAIENGFQQYAEPARKRSVHEPLKKDSLDKKRLTIVLEC